MDGSPEAGSFAHSAASQQGSGARAERRELLDTAATANIVCFAWIRIRNGLLEKSGYDAAAPHPASALCKFGDGEVEIVRRAAVFPIALADRMSVSATFLAGQNIPALLSEGALESLRGR